MRIRTIVLQRRWDGWSCELAFSVFTVDQFTAVQHTTGTFSRWAWLAFARSVLRAHREYRSMVAKPGERGAKGWL